MPVGKAFLFANAALIAGVASASFVFGRPFLIYIIGVLVIFGAIVAAKKSKSLLLLIAVLTGFAVGYARMAFEMHSANAAYEQLVAVTGETMYGDVVEAFSTQKQAAYIVSIPRVGNVQVTLYDQSIQLGAHVEVRCKQFMDFSLALLGSKNVVAACEKGELRAMGISANPLLLSKVRARNVRGHLSGIISQAIPSPEAELLQGIVLGEKRALTKHMQQNLQKTGTTHIVVLSGYNIAILASMCIALLRRLRLGIRRTTFFVMAITFGFVLLTGFSSPSVRALIMCGAVLLTKSFGRKTSPFAILCISASCMILVDPTILGFSMSFQLSFLATIGVIASEKVLPLFFWLPSQLAIRENIVTTICATLCTVPIIAFGFGTISVVSVVVNALVLPLVPLAMACGAIAVCMGLFSSGIALYVGVFAFTVSRVINWIIESFASLSFSSLNIGSIHWMFVYIFYGALLCGFIVLTKRKQEKDTPRTTRIGIIPTVSMSVVALICVYVMASPRLPTLRFAFYDVGQGDASLLRTKSGYDVVIDGGPDSSVLTGLGNDMPYFDREIDVIVLTHPHADHITGIIEIVKRYKVKKIIVSNGFDENELGKKLRDMSLQKHIVIQKVKAGDTWQDKASQLQFDVFSPSFTPHISDLNDVSVVVRVSSPFVSALYMGDAGQSIEEKILKTQKELSVDILKVGHHGSNRSTSESFLRAVNPAFGIISVGEKNPYGHPHKQTVDRLQKYGVKPLRTDTCGSIRFDFSQTSRSIDMGPCQLDKFADK